MAMKKPGSTHFSGKQEGIDEEEQSLNLYRWYHQLEKGNPPRDFVPLILEKLRENENAAQTRTLRSILQLEYARQGRDAELFADLETQIQENPGDPYPRIRLAEQYLYHRDMPERALEILDEAITLCKSTARYFFYASGVKARCANKLGRHDLLAITLTEMMDWNPADTRVDVPPETDFVRRLPPGFISHELVGRYLQFVQHVREVWDNKYRT
jgi:tetratricopeptide (TPR) repeat protein